MAISVDDIKKLRDLTGVGLTDAKRALEESEGDFDKALEEMRKKGLTRAEKKGDREARMGLVDSYVHDNRIGVVVEVNCETDFVARLDDFKRLVHEVAMQVAAMNPIAVTAESIPAEIKEKELEIAREKAREAGKPENLLDRIAEGALQKFYKESTLLQQEYVKDPKKTIEQFLKESSKDLSVTAFKRVSLNV